MSLLAFVSGVILAYVLPPICTACGILGEQLA